MLTYKKDRVVTLYIPESYNSSRLVCFDPGLNTTGVSVFDVDSRTKRVSSVYAYTIYNDKLGDVTGLDSEILTERTFKLYKLCQGIHNAIDYFKPSIVGCEAPFYNRLMPMAFVSLSEVVSMIRHTVIQYNYNIPFYLVEPQKVKQGVGVAGKKGKQVVMDAIRNIPELMDNLTTPLDSLDEHAVDAIAVGWSMLKFKI